jgi:hypothetical protein
VLVQTSLPVFEPHLGRKAPQLDGTCGINKAEKLDPNGFKIIESTESLMGETVLLRASQKRLFANLPPDDSQIAENLIWAVPNHRYDLSGLPKLDPPPAPGPASGPAARRQ